MLAGIFCSAQSLSCVRLFVTPWTAARQTSPSITNYRSPPRPMSIELVMPSNHHILCHLSPPSFNLSWHQGPFKWVSSSHQVAKVLESQLQHHRADRLKPQLQTTSQSDHRTTMKLSHAVWGHPRWTGYGGEIWQNVVHWRRECKPLQYSCLVNPVNSMKRQKGRTLKDELPRSVGAQYATGDQWINNSRKNEGMESKQKQYLVVDVTGDRIKVRCCKEEGY